MADSYATKTDIKELRNEMRKSEKRIITQVAKLIASNNSTLITNLASNEELETTKKELKEDISHLPTKEEFYAETSKIYGRLDVIETEKDVLSH